MRLIILVLLLARVTGLDRFLTNCNLVWPRQREDRILHGEDLFDWWISSELDLHHHVRVHHLLAGFDAFVELASDVDASMIRLSHSGVLMHVSAFLE